MSWRPGEPYNELPLLPPAREGVETVEILKACMPARAALAELKQAGELIPNQTLLINLLPLRDVKCAFFITPTPEIAYCHGHFPFIVLHSVQFRAKVSDTHKLI